jgi:hypothetical protein
MQDSSQAVSTRMSQTSGICFIKRDFLLQKDASQRNSQLMRTPLQLKQIVPLQLKHSVPLQLQLKHSVPLQLKQSVKRQRSVPRKRQG